jgi:hypothetical protein
MKPKRVSVRIVVFVLASIVLAGALALAALLGSPYKTLKDAIIEAVSFANLTMEGEIWLTVGGERILFDKSHEINGGSASLHHRFDKDGNPSGFYYTNESQAIFKTTEDENGVQWYVAFVDEPDPHWSEVIGWGLIFPDERGSLRIHLTELFINVLVGDMKNNITQSKKSGIRTIRGTLTENQVPELIKAYIDYLLEDNFAFLDNLDISFDGHEYIWEENYMQRNKKVVTRYTQTVRAPTAEELAALEDGTFWDKPHLDEVYGTVDINDEVYIATSWRESIGTKTVPLTREDVEGLDFLDTPIRSSVIHHVHAEAEIDDDDNLLSFSGTALFTLTDIFGDEHEVEANFSYTFTGHGTSVALCPVPGAAELLTRGFMDEHFGAHHKFVYFTLTPGGSIDPASLTTDR